MSRDLADRALQISKERAPWVAGIASAKALAWKYTWRMQRVEGRLGGLEESEEEKCILFDLKGMAFPKAKWGPWVPAVGWCWLVKVHPNAILTRKPAGVQLQIVADRGSHSPLSPSGITWISP